MSQDKYKPMNYLIFIQRHLIDNQRADFKKIFRKYLTFINYVYIMGIMKNWTSAEIKEFRKSMGLTQAKYADVLGVTQVYIAYLEKGVRQPGTTMKRLLDCLERQNENEKGKE